MLRTVGFAVVALFTATSAFAAGGGGEHHEPVWRLTLLAMVNFAIFVAVIRKAAWPLVADYLKTRREDVVTALEAAQKAKDEAAAIRAEFDEKMKGLEAEAAKAREDLLAVARTEADKLIAQANETADRIKRDASLVADQEVNRAKAALQEESAALITEIATELVSKQVTAEDQQRFIQEFLAETREVQR